MVGAIMRWWPSHGLSVKAASFRYSAQVALGDQAGEHLEMERGKAKAWPHVIAGATLFGLITLFLLSALLDAIFHGVFPRVDLSLFTSVLAFVLTPVVVAAVYFDFWRVNEAYTSRHVTGLIAIAYVPLISVGYAMTRFGERVQALLGLGRPAP